jgi:hypothetical protein
MPPVKGSNSHDPILNLTTNNATWIVLVFAWTGSTATLCRGFLLHFSSFVPKAPGSEYPKKPKLKPKRELIYPLCGEASQLEVLELQLPKPLTYSLPFLY